MGRGIERGVVRGDSLSHITKLEQTSIHVTFLFLFSSFDPILILIKASCMIFFIC